MPIYILFADSKKGKIHVDANSLDLTTLDYDLFTQILQFDKKKKMIKMYISNFTDKPM